MVKAGAFPLERPMALVQSDKIMQATRKISASQAVNFFNTSAVDVPKSDSLVSPPKEAPKPELLLSCIKITVQSKTQRIKKRVIVKKYKNVMLINLFVFGNDDSRFA